VFTINQNGCSPSARISVHDQSESVFMMGRNMHIAVVSAFAIGFLTFSDKNQRWLGTAIIGGILGLALHRASRNYDFVI